MQGASLDSALAVAAVPIGRDFAPLPRHMEWRSVVLAADALGRCRRWGAVDCDHMAKYGLLRSIPDSRGEASALSAESLQPSELRRAASLPPVPPFLEIRSSNLLMREIPLSGSLYVASPFVLRNGILT